MLSLLVLGKAFYIQRFQGSHWRSMSDSMHQRFVQLPAERGNIYSEDGQMLSISIPLFDIYIDLNADGLREKKGKRFYENVDSFAITLSNFFGDSSAAKYKNSLLRAYKKGERYHPLKKGLSFENYKAFREYPFVKAGKNKSGVITEITTKRITPFKLLANKTIGFSSEYTDVNKQKKKEYEGLEKSYDSVLSGHNGQKIIRFIAGGTGIPVEGSETDPVNGQDVFTTLDINIQDITETELLKTMQQCQGQYGTAIVMETSTGKIKAMANLGRKEDGTYQELSNYALWATEPGSTMKLVTLLSVLEKGTSSLTDVIEVGSTGKAKVGNKIVSDAERSPKPSLTVKECFAHSSNIGMSQLAYKAFSQKPVEFKEYLHRFYLDVKSPIDLSNVSNPVIVPLDKKGSAEGNLLWMSFGYGIQVSPLQTLTLYNAIANNGKMMKPYLVNSIQRNGIISKLFQPTVMAENICKPSVINDAKASMEMVVTDGTAKLAFKDMPFAVAGKTGTSQVADAGIKYDQGYYQASFVGYFPADKPQYTCIVLIRTKPNTTLHYGGTLAAPVFREIAKKVYAMYVEKKTPSFYAVKKDSSKYFYSGFTNDIRNIYGAMNIGYKDSSDQNNLPSGQADWSCMYPINYQPVMKVINVRRQMMPNVKGMGLKDAVYLLENMGVKVSVKKGRGKIMTQSVAPGTTLAKGVTVILELS